MAGNGMGKEGVDGVPDGFVEAALRRVVAMGSNFAVFLRGGGKTFVIFVDHEVGSAIAMYKDGVPRSRPLTHELLISILDGLEIGVDKVLINDLMGNTFYARLFLRGRDSGLKRIFEIDARPSDCIAIALLSGAPILVAKHVLDAVNDVGDSPMGGVP